MPVSDEENPGSYGYEAAFLPSGDYTVSYSCSPDDNDIDESLVFIGTRNVSVEAGAESVADFD